MDDARLWKFIFGLVVMIGSIVIFANLLVPDGTTFPTGVNLALVNGYRLLAIFLGVLAGTALGEILKARSNNQTGKKLLEDLIEELKINLTLIDKRISLRKGFWALGIRSGRAEYLETRDRRDLWEIYSRITHYNEDLQFIHRQVALEQTEQKMAHIDEFCKKISTLIREFLEKKNVSRKKKRGSN